MKSAAVVYCRAKTLDEAVSRGASGDGLAKYLAGGQSLIPMMNLRLAMPQTLIDISRLANLRESRIESGRLFVGAGVTHAMIEDGKIQDSTRGYLKQVAGGIAYRSIRNRGTMGGSLVHADPAADWPAALLALDAVAVVHGWSGAREVPLASFHVGLMETCLQPEEVLLGIWLPVLSAQASWSYLKFCRKVGEFGHSIAAVVIDPKLGLANVILGAASDKPCKLIRVSEYLASSGRQAESIADNVLGPILDKELAELVDHSPGTYEFHLHRTMVIRAVRGALKT